MTAKIEKWMRLAARVIADEWMRNWSSDTLSMRIDSIAAIIAAHAPQEPPEWEAKEKALRELADRWMDEMKPTTTPVIHQSLICHEHALCIRAILNTPAAGEKEQP